jgi:hypothetical protein
VLCVLATGNARAADFIGAESCRACHQAAFDQWKGSPHARAFQTLTAEHQKDTKCLQCHARDSAQGGDPGVTCETCHGAGQYYWPEYVMRDKELAKATGLTRGSAADVKACAQCHNASSPTMRPFDPAAAMKAIDHWSKDKASRSSKSASCPRPAEGALAQGRRPSETFVGRLLRQPTKQANASGKVGGDVRVAVATAGRVGSPASTATSATKAD